MSSKKPASIVLATVESKVCKSAHEIRKDHEGNLYCNCPQFKFMRGARTERTCEHMRAFAARVMTMAKNAQETPVSKDVAAKLLGRSGTLVKRFRAENAKFWAERKAQRTQPQAEEMSVTMATETKPEVTAAA